MNYTQNSYKALESFVTKINNYLLVEMKIEISDLVKLESFFKNPENKAITGSLILKFSSKNELEDGTTIRLCETYIFESNKYFVKTSSEENFYNEYYSNNDYRIGDDEWEEHIPKLLSDALKEVFSILIDDERKIEICTNHFHLKTIRKKKSEG